MAISIDPTLVDKDLQATMRLVSRQVDHLEMLPGMVQFGLHPKYLNNTWTNSW